MFTSADARRHFFNAGGTITFVSSLTSTASGENVAKTNDWSTMLSPMQVQYLLVTTILQLVILEQEVQ